MAAANVPTGLAAIAALRPRKQANKPQRSGWERDLIETLSGAPKALLANAILALEHHPDWLGALAFDEFTSTVNVVKDNPCGIAQKQITDQDDRLITAWLQHHDIHVNVDVAGQAIQTVAQKSPFHPVRQFLDSLKWDGVNRTKTWLSAYCGAENDEYSREVGERFLISAVARVMEPGCQVDSALILEGKQGIRKSSAVRELGRPWMAEEIADLGSKDSSLQTCGVWIIELSELDAMSKGDIAKIKAFMSRRTDRFRPPYGRRLIESKRQCVFMGTVNQSTYLLDETGGRRFWPVKVTSIDIDAIKRDREQLWAEALHLYTSKHPWYLDTPELIGLATDQQSDRFQGDVWHERIERWLSTQTDVSVAEILTDCLHKPAADWTQTDKNRIARTLQALGLERFRARFGSTREWRYRRQDD